MIIKEREHAVVTVFLSVGEYRDIFENIKNIWDIYF